MNESMKSIKSSLDETWKNTTSLQYGTVVHVASLKKYSESTDEYKKDFTMFDQEFQSVRERMDQLNSQFIEFSSKMYLEEKKKSDLSKAVKTAVLSKQSLEKAIEASSQRILDTEKALSEMNINLSSTLSELQNKERLLQSTLFETKQQEENEKAAKSELESATERKEKNAQSLNDLVQKIEHSKTEKEEAISNLDLKGKEVFNEVTKSIDMEIEQINQDVEQRKSSLSSRQEDLKNLEGVTVQQK